MLQHIGVDTHVITARELRELQPLCQVGDLVVAAYEPKSGYADPRATFVDITPFRLRRFEEHQPIQGLHEYTLPEGCGHRV